MNLSLIIGGVIVVIILYIIWGYFFTTTQVLMSFQAADTQTIVRGNTIAESGRNVYSFSLWTYINDWGQAYGQEKNILEVATSPPPSPDVGPLDGTVFKLAFDKERNDLLIYVNGVHHTSILNPTCSITNFPLQSWVNISVSVYGRAVDVYIDGKLVKTCSLDSVAALISKSDNIYIGGVSPRVGFSGFIASVTYTPSQMSPQDAWDNYARGYNNTTFGLGNLFQRYKMQIAFLKDNSVINSVTI